MEKVTISGKGAGKPLLGMAVQVPVLMVVELVFILILTSGGPFPLFVLGIIAIIGIYLMLTIQTLYNAAQQKTLEIDDRGVRLRYGDEEKWAFGWEKIEFLRSHERSATRPVDRYYEFFERFHDGIILGTRDDEAEVNTLAHIGPKEKMVEAFLAIAKEMKSRDKKVSDEVGWYASYWK